MTRYRNEYERWLQFADKATVEELKVRKNNSNIASAKI